MANPGPDVLEMFQAVADRDNPGCLLSAELRILRINAGWIRFAEDNGGAGLLTEPRGASVLDAIPAALRDFYRDGFDRALTTGVRWEHDYECSSDQLFREFRMIAFPIEGAFLVVEHALRVARPHDREAVESDDAAYAHDGLLRMCAHCRRVRAVGSDERWDWVPAYVAQMPLNVSHGLCPPCVQFYYP